MTVKSKITLVECVVGIFAFDEQNNVVEVVFFQKNVEEVVEVIQLLRRGESVIEVVNIVKRLSEKGYREFVLEDGCLAQTMEDSFDVKVFVEEFSKAGDYLRSNLGKLVVERGFVETLDEFYKFIHGVYAALARISVRKASEKRDLIVLQTVFIFDDLDKTFNLFVNRLREWYGYHFPELSSLVNKSETYVQLVASLGERCNFTVKNIADLGLGTRRAKAISKATTASMGAEMGEKDINEIRSFSNMLLELYASRNKMELYLRDVMGEVAPNISELVGSTLGARLVAAVGGLKSLSKKSSGTIQLLGAEKALFRSLKTGSKPPKHGLIFQQKDVHQSPRWQRGKIARALANKLAIASRLDAYGGAYLGNKLKEEFSNRVEEIKAKYADPPRKGKR